MLFLHYRLPLTCTHFHSKKNFGCKQSRVINVQPIVWIPLMYTQSLRSLFFLVFPAYFDAELLPQRKYRPARLVPMVDWATQSSPCTHEPTLRPSSSSTFLPWCKSLLPPPSSPSYVQSGADLHIRGCYAVLASSGCVMHVAVTIYHSNNSLKQYIIDRGRHWQKQTKTDTQAVSNISLCKFRIKVLHTLAPTLNEAFIC